MLDLLYRGEFALFLLILIAIVISLSFHEFGHAYVAKRFGDRTAELAGRLTLNPLAHIDPMGLLMVVMVGFGYAKPVPTNPRNFTSPKADLLVSAAGPFMNLLIAVVTANLYSLGVSQQLPGLSAPGPLYFLFFLAQINLLLMVFNLIPLGALDGHYILPYFLPRHVANRYTELNARYGNMILFGLIILSIMGLPIFQSILAFGRLLMPLITFV